MSFNFDESVKTLSPIISQLNTNAFDKINPEHDVEELVLPNESVLYNKKITIENLNGQISKFKIYGRCVQEETPVFNNPQPIKTFNNGKIIIDTNGNTQEIEIPFDLRENDYIEVDIKNKEVYKMTYTEKFSIKDNFNINSIHAESDGTFFITDIDIVTPKPGANVFSNIVDSDDCSYGSDGLGVYIKDNTFEGNVQKIYEYLINNQAYFYVPLVYDEIYNYPKKITETSFGESILNFISKYIVEGATITANTGDTNSVDTNIEVQYPTSQIGNVIVKDKIVIDNFDVFVQEAIPNNKYFDKYLFNASNTKGIKNLYNFTLLTFSAIKTIRNFGGYYYYTNPDEKIPLFDKIKLCYTYKGKKKELFFDYKTYGEKIYKDFTVWLPTDSKKTEIEYMYASSVLVENTNPFKTIIVQGENNKIIVNSIDGCRYHLHSGIVNNNQMYLYFAKSCYWIPPVNIPSIDTMCVGGGSCGSKGEFTGYDYDSDHDIRACNFLTGKGGNGGKTQILSNILTTDKIFKIEIGLGGIYTEDTSKVNLKNGGNTVFSLIDNNNTLMNLCICEGGVQDTILKEENYSGEGEGPYEYEVRTASNESETRVYNSQNSGTVEFNENDTALVRFGSGGRVGEGRIKYGSYYQKYNSVVYKNTNIIYQGQGGILDETFANEEIQPDSFKWEKDSDIFLSMKGKQSILSNTGAGGGAGAIEFFYEYDPYKHLTRIIVFLGEGGNGSDGCVVVRGVMK